VSYIIADLDECELAGYEKKFQKLAQELGKL
jgi:hypothetical protein